MGKRVREGEHATGDRDTAALRPARLVPGPGQAPGDLEPCEDGFDPHDPRWYLNRELTWLCFNERVLQQAADPRVPLLERVKFLAIVGSNLDEFYMKRIGGLKQQLGAGLRVRTADGRTPREQIDACALRVADQALGVDLERKLLLGALEKHDVIIRHHGQLGEEQRARLRQHYVENIFPLVTPQAIDSAHPFPFVSNLSLNLLVTLSYPRDASVHYARVKIPLGVGIPRLVPIDGQGHHFVPIEDLMAANLDLLFPDMEVGSCELFRVTRNANTETAEEHADDLLALIQSELRERKFAPIVRLEVQSDMDHERRGRLAAELGLDGESEVFEVDGMLAPGHLMELNLLDLPQLRYPEHQPIDHPVLASEPNIFQAIREVGALLLHHPYESFSSSVERFLREASEDPKVLAIKMTLYRTSEDSNVVDYLINAARNGKQVAVAVELKARFDEAANIQWASALEDVGIHVSYGVMGLKTHSKVTLVVRRDQDGLRRYAHIGTGNYHAGTARQYSDMGMLSCDPEIGQDLSEFFNYLTTGYRPRRKYGRLLVAPKVLKQRLLDKIAREARHAREGREAAIQLKTNALEDPELIRALYEASGAGVQIDLLVRDTCCLRPGVPGVSENIRVMSTVGRFLEHTRIYHFRNNGKEQYYIGSADLMTRNLENRVEVLVPLERKELRAELRLFLDAQLADRRSVWDMDRHGAYVQRQPVTSEEERDSQHAMIAWAAQVDRQATKLRRRRPRQVVRRVPPVRGFKR